MRDSENATGAGGAAEWPEGGGSEPLTVVDGRYAIERELGRGGSAVVYLARDVRDDSRVALKLLHQEFSGSKAAERFSLEVRLLREFEHPAILSVTDAGEWQGRPFYVMPFVDGESLQDRLRRERRLPFDEVVRIGRRLCDALAYAHERKVVHRDVKPANVMLAGDAVYLTDFGVAKALEPVEGAPHSTTGVARGTRAYMSPEQLTADRDLDQRSDIFSLGCVLYEMIAGVRPYASADEGRELMRRLVEAPDPLKRHRDGVPPGLEAVVMKALAREPADRWQGVEEVGRGLGGATVPSRWVNEHRLGLAGISLATVLLVSIGVRQFGREAQRPIDWISAPLAVAPVIESSSDSVGSTVSRYAARALLQSLLSLKGVPLIRLGAVADGENLSHASALAKAREGGARLLVEISSRTVGEDAVATVSLTDCDPDSLIRTEQFRFPLTELRSSRIAERFYSAALRRLPPTTLTDDPLGTSDYRSIRLLQAAIEHIESWRVESASVALRQALEFEPQLQRAHLLLAELAFWNTEAGPAIREHAAIALAAVQETDSTLLLAGNALASLGRDDHAQACEGFRQLATIRPASFEAWFSLGECYRRDPVVVKTGQPPRVWRFRSDLAQAESAYSVAVKLAKGRLVDLAYERLLTVFYVESGSARVGMSEPPHDERYVAFPSLQGDSVVFDPLPLSIVSSGSQGSVPGTLYAALERERRRKLQVTRAWLSAAPGNVSALTNHALALESVGDVNPDVAGESEAIRLVRQAIVLSSDSIQRLRSANVLVRLELKQRHHSHVVALVDSLLQAASDPVGEQAELLAPLAALIAREREARRMLSAASREAEVVSKWPERLADPLLQNVLAELYVRTAFGECGRVVGDLWRRLDALATAVTDSLTAERRSAEVLEQARRLYMPCDSGRASIARPRADAPLVSLVRAALSGDTMTANQMLRRLDESRAGVSAAEVSWDAVLLEAWSLAQVGRREQAALRIDRAVLALPRSSARLTQDVAIAASFGRALALRTQLDGDIADVRGGGDASIAARQLGWRRVFVQDDGTAR